VLDEIVAVRFSRSAVVKLQQCDDVGAAWSALCGERLRAIAKAAAAPGSITADPSPIPATASLVS